MSALLLIGAALMVVFFLSLVVNALWPVDPHVYDDDDDS